MTQRIILLCTISFLGCLVQIAGADPGKDESGKQSWNNSHAAKQHPPGHKKKDSPAQDNYFHAHGHTRLEIPQGHYPPPGECRIWFPGQPPGHQPPPVPCGSPVPAGAWLIHQPPATPGLARITVYAPRQPGVILAVGEFAIDSGALLRVLME